MSSYDEHLISQAGGDGGMWDGSEATQAMAGRVKVQLEDARVLRKQWESKADDYESNMLRAKRNADASASEVTYLSILLERLLREARK